MVEWIDPRQEHQEVVRFQGTVLLGFLKRDPLYARQVALLDRMQRKYGERLRCLVYREGFLDAGMRRHMVRGTPSYVLLERGDEVDRLVGVSDAETMDAFLSRCLNRR